MPDENRCPTPVDLLLTALGRPDAGPDDNASHFDTCAECQRAVSAFTEIALALRTLPPDRTRDPRPCLDELELARLADGADPAADRQAIEHVAKCTPCQTRLVGVLRLLNDPLVADRIAEVEGGRGARRQGRGVQSAAVGALAAAAIATFLFWPQAAPDGAAPGSGPAPTFRERTITTTAAPRIVGPLADASAVDSLRWTSVPRADLYRITVWDLDGSVAWQGQTRDTVLALPTEVVAYDASSFLWEVKARTGWDRWVASELAELSLSGGAGT